MIDEKKELKKLKLSQVGIKYIEIINISLLVFI